MSLIQALVLGIVQGLTEFLPVSSDGHLILVPFILGWKQPSLAFIVALHIGTLFSLLWVFRKRFIDLLTGLVGARKRPEQRRMFLLIVLGTIPAALVGGLLESWVNDSLERPVLAAILLGVNGWALLSAESAYEDRMEKPRGEEGLRPLDALVVGAAQATAIAPGISRSGMTIASGMAMGVSREAATRFSFLLAAPIILGAIIFKIPDMIAEGAAGQTGALAVGIVMSAISGVLAIRGLLAVVARRGLRSFGLYCFLAMTAGLLTALARG